MNEFLTMLKLYSVQVVLALAGLNSVIALFDAPAWLVIVVNVCGYIAHNYLRAKPQPAVTAELKSIRAQKLRAP